MTEDCPDCGVRPGEEHHEACDVARCLMTGMQRLTCLEEHDHGRQAWTGRWPGVAECVEFGWWAYLAPGCGWVRCDGPGWTGATPDLNRLPVDATWDRERERWVRP